MDQEKQVDESWKESAAKEKESFGAQAGAQAEEPRIHVAESFKKDEETDQSSGASQEPSREDLERQAAEAMKINFLNYVTSLGFQAMVFLGEIPNPVTNKVEKSLEQAKFLIDTLAMLKDKTKGNLTDQEENILNGSVYELQMKFVEVSQKQEKNEAKEESK